MLNAQQVIFNHKYETSKNIKFACNATCDGSAKYKIRLSGNSNTGFYKRREKNGAGISGYGWEKIDFLLRKFFEKRFGDGKNARHEKF